MRKAGKQEKEIRGQVLTCFPIRRAQGPEPVETAAFLSLCSLRSFAAIRCKGHSSGDLPCTMRKPCSPQRPSGLEGAIRKPQVARRRATWGYFPQRRWRCIVDARRFSTMRLALHRELLAIFHNAVGVATRTPRDFPQRRWRCIVDARRRGFLVSEWQGLLDITGGFGSGLVR